MSLPTDLIFPNIESYEDPVRYSKELTFTLQQMYEQMVQLTNGSFRSSADVESSQWLPTLAGTTAAGAFTYVNRYGWSMRSGIMNDVWADVSWSATTATGNLYLELPYLVTKSSGAPFVGICQTSSITYTAGTNVVISAIPNTFRGEIWTYGSGVATGNQAVVSSGRIIIFLRYIGISDG